MMASRLVRAAAVASVTLVLSGVVLQVAFVNPLLIPARAELAALRAEDERRAQRAAFESPDATHPFLRTTADFWDEELLELKQVLPESRDDARDGFLAALRRIGAWSAELESLDWSERSAGGAYYSEGKARVRIDPSGRGWLGTVRGLLHAVQRVRVDCVDVSNLSNPSAPVTLDVTLYAQPSEPWRMIPPSADAARARRFQWADVVRRASKAPVEITDIADASMAPVLGSISRGGCNAMREICPIYSVVIHEDGIVDYQGEEWVKIEGTHRYRIGMDRVRALSEAFDRAGFGSFDSSYSSPLGGSPTVEVSHRGKTVHHEGGPSACFHQDVVVFEPVEVALTRLEDDFDRIVGTELWIGTMKERQVFWDVHR